LRRTREERGVLSTRHQSDAAALQSSIRAAYIKADEEIDKIVSPDRMSLAQQHQDKLRCSGDKFDSFVNAAFDQSIEDYQAGRSIGNIEAVEGRAVIVNRSRETRDATVGGAVYLGETVRTERGARVSIVFNDDTSLVVAESANIPLDRTIYDPQEYDGISWLASLFRYVSALVASTRGDPDQPVKPIDFGCICIRG